MKAKELRIGNYVLKNKKFHYVNWRTIRDIYYDDIDSEDVFEPHQITEEWLLKFGFEKSDSSIYWHQKTIANDVKLCVSNIGYIEIEDMDDTIIELSNSVNSGCEYVHQLQNLYFALTGEELKLK